MASDRTFIIIGVHRTSREVVVWAGKAGFVPVTRAVEGPPPEAREIPGNVADSLMKEITKGRVGRKYEFVLIPLLKLGEETRPPESPGGLILPPGAGLH